MRSSYGSNRPMRRFAYTVADNRTKANNGASSFLQGGPFLVAKLIETIESFRHLYFGDSDSMCSSYHKCSTFQFTSCTLQKECRSCICLLIAFDVSPSIIALMIVSCSLLISVRSELRWRWTQVAYPGIVQYDVIRAICFINVYLCSTGTTLQKLERVNPHSIVMRQFRLQPLHPTFSVLPSASVGLL